MKLDLSLKDLRRTTSLCLRCNVCTYSEWPDNHSICAIYEYHRVFTASPGGLVYLLRALIDEQIDYHKTMAEFAFQCTLCQKCDICEILPIAPPHMTPSDLVRFFRNQLLKKGFIPEGIKGFHEEIKRGVDHSTEKMETPLYESTHDPAADSVLFVEGLNPAAEKKTYPSLIRLFKKMGKNLSVFYLGSSMHELYDLGFWDELDLAVRKKQKAIRALDGKQVIFLDPHCQEFMVKRYPQIASENPRIEAKHMSEVLFDALEEGRLKSNRRKIKVTYHDPCHLSRGLGIHDVPRKLLVSLGADLIEMERHGLNTYCCGAGGRERPFPEFSDWVAGERIKEFKKTGAELFITACPHCKEQIQKVLPLEERNEVVDLVEFVDQQTE